MLHTRSSKPCCMIFLLYNLGFTVSSTCKLALSYFLTTVSSISSYKNIGHFSFLAPPLVSFLSFPVLGNNGHYPSPNPKDLQSSDHLFSLLSSFFSFFSLYFPLSLSLSIHLSLLPSFLWLIHLSYTPWARCSRY